MDIAYFIAACVGLLFVLNARRPPRWPVVSVPAFFAAWLTSELAVQLLVVHAAAMAFFAVLVEPGTWAYWATLGLGLVIAIGLALMVAEARRVYQVLDDALDEITGPGDVDTTIPWRRLIFPFFVRDKGVERTKDVPYAQGGRRHLLDVWRRPDAAPGAPCLIQIHGSGWTVSNKNQQGKPICIEMASRGWVCFAINYPLSPRATHPDHIVGVKKAIAWVHENAHAYGGDPSFLLLTGGSAGGHLTALAALTPGETAFQPGFEDADTTVQAAVPVYGVYDFTESTISGWPRSAQAMKRSTIRYLERAVMKRNLSTDRDVFVEASPIHRVGEHAPPFLVIHGTSDTLAPVEEAQAFAVRLRETSREPVAYAELPGAPHAFDVFTSIRTVHTMRAIARFAEWAHQRWKARSVGPASAPTDRDARGPTPAP